MLAASSGGLAAVKCLIDLGAYVLRTDEKSNNVIHLAALRFHTNILEFFIEWNHTDVPVWQLLVGEHYIDLSYLELQENCIILVELSLKDEKNGVLE